jgi:hypothetical protein
MLLSIIVRLLPFSDSTPDHPAQPALTYQSILSQPAPTPHVQVVLEATINEAPRPLTTPSIAAPARKVKRQADLTTLIGSTVGYNADGEHCLV